MKLLTALGNSRIALEASIIETMEELDVRMPPVVLLCMSDADANRTIRERTKNDDKHSITPIQAVPGNFRGHEIYLVIVGPTRGLEFKVSSDPDTIFAHLKLETIYV